MPPFDLPEGSARSAGIAVPRAVARPEHAFLASVYLWMSAGLALTAVVSLLTVSTPALLQLVFGNQIVFFALMIAQLGLVIGVSAAINRISAGTATLLFLLYAALTGVTLAVVLLAYTGASITSAFVVSAGMFGALAVYGTTTKTSLAGWGSFLFMGLIGVVLASVVGLFWQNDTMQFVIAIVGVIVFTGLTAYDSQRLKAMALALPEDKLSSYAISGALSLYLNFINLFLSMLRLMGNRR